MEETQKTGMNPVVIVGIIAVIAVAGIGFFMMNKGKTANVQNNQMVAEGQTGTEQKKMAPSEAVTQASSDSAQAMNKDEVQIVNVEAGSFYYKPNEIRVKKGQKVKIVMKAVSMMHDFNIDELNVKMPIVKNGNTGEVEFTASKVGTFEYYCSVGQHRANGQVGKLIVEE